MAELPKSWGLKTRKRQDGKLDIVGKDDFGREYKARTCANPFVTDKDIQDLADADREQTTAKEAVAKIVNAGAQSREAQENAFHDDLTEAACEVVYGTRTRRGRGVSISEKLGYSRKYARGWEAAFGGN